MTMMMMTMKMMLAVVIMIAHTSIPGAYAESGPGKTAGGTGPPDFAATCRRPKLCGPHESNAFSPTSTTPLVPLVGTEFEPERALTLTDGIDLSRFEGVLGEFGLDLSRDTTTTLVISSDGDNLVVVVQNDTSTAYVMIRTDRLDQGGDIIVDAVSVLGSCVIETLADVWACFCASGREVQRQLEAFLPIEGTYTRGGGGNKCWYCSPEQSAEHARACTAFRVEAGCCGEPSGNSASSPTSATFGTASVVTGSAMLAMVGIVIATLVRMVVVRGRKIAELEHAQQHESVELH